MPLLRWMRMQATMTGMVMVYRQAVNAVRLSVEPRLASWDRAGHPSQVGLASFLAHVDALAAPAMTAVRGRVAVDLTVGLPDTVSLIDGGRDLDNYLLPVARQLGPDRVAAMFGRKIHGPSSLAVGPAAPEATVAIPQFSTRMAGSCERREWKQDLHDRLLRAHAATMDPGPVAMTIAMTTGPGRNWANLWKPLIDAFGPVLGEDINRPFHPCDDRIVSLSLHHHVNVGLARDVIIDAWWARS
jgi:hypothetical protein